MAYSTCVACWPSIAVTRHVSSPLLKAAHTPGNLSAFTKRSLLVSAQPFCSKSRRASSRLASTGVLAKYTRRAVVTVGVSVITASREYATHSVGTGMSSKARRGTVTAVVEHAESATAATIARVLTRRIVSSRHGPRSRPSASLVARASGDPGARSRSRRPARPGARQRRSAGGHGSLGIGDRLRPGIGQAASRPVRPSRQFDRGVFLALRRISRQGRVSHGARSLGRDRAGRRDTSWLGHLRSRVPTRSRILPFARNVDRLSRARL